MNSYLRSILQLTLSPSRGWDDLSRADARADDLLQHGFYPLTAITSLSCFVRMFYHSDMSVSGALTLALVTFVQFFATYFIGTSLLSLWIVPAPSEANAAITDTREARNRVDTFVVFALSLLAISTLLANLIPAEISIVQILPVYVAFIMIKGGRFLGVSSDNSLRFALAAMAAVLLPVYLLRYLFTSVL